MNLAIALSTGQDVSQFPQIQAQQAQLLAQQSETSGVAGNQWQGQEKKHWKQLQNFRTLTALDQHCYPEHRHSSSTSASQPLTESLAKSQSSFTRTTTPSTPYTIFLQSKPEQSFSDRSLSSVLGKRVRDLSRQDTELMFNSGVGVDMDANSGDTVVMHDIHDPHGLHESVSPPPSSMASLASASSVSSVSSTSPAVSTASISNPTFRAGSMHDGSFMLNPISWPSTS